MSSDLASNASTEKSSSPSTAKRWGVASVAHIFGSVRNMTMKESKEHGGDSLGVGVSNGDAGKPKANKAPSVANMSPSGGTPKSVSPSSVNSYVESSKFERPDILPEEKRLRRSGSSSSSKLIKSNSSQRMRSAEGDKLDSYLEERKSSSSTRGGGGGGGDGGGGAGSGSGSGAGSGSRTSNDSKKDSNGEEEIPKLSSPEASAEMSKQEESPTAGGSEARLTRSSSDRAERSRLKASLLGTFLDSIPRAKGDLETQSAYTSLSKARSKQKKRDKKEEVPSMPTVKEELMSFLSTLPKTVEKSNKNKKTGAVGTDSPDRGRRRKIGAMATVERRQRSRSRRARSRSRGAKVKDDVGLKPSRHDDSTDDRRRARSKSRARRKDDDTKDESKRSRKDEKRKKKEEAKKDEKREKDDKKTSLRISTSVRKEMGGQSMSKSESSRKLSKGESSRRLSKGESPQKLPKDKSSRRISSKGESTRRLEPISALDSSQGSLPTEGVSPQSMLSPHRSNDMEAQHHHHHNHQRSTRGATEDLASLRHESDAPRRKSEVSSSSSRRTHKSERTERREATATLSVPGEDSSPPSTPKIKNRHELLISPASRSKRSSSRVRSSSRSRCSAVPSDMVIVTKSKASGRSKSVDPRRSAGDGRQSSKSNADGTRDRSSKQAESSSASHMKHEKSSGRARSVSPVAAKDRYAALLKIEDGENKALKHFTELEEELDGSIGATEETTVSDGLSPPDELLTESPSPRKKEKIVTPAKDAAPMSPSRRMTQVQTTTVGFVSPTTTSQKSDVKDESNVDYEEEDVFTFYSWSVAHQDPQKVQKERMLLKESIRATPLYRAFQHINVA